MASRRSSIRIGTGSAWWGDRIEPAKLNADRGDLDYLCFETMAEATISTAQVRKRRDPDFPGYDTYLDDRMQAVLPGCLKRGTKIVSNQGWINPDGAAKRIVYWLQEMGARGKKVAAVSGSLITDRVLEQTETIMENGLPTSTLRDSMVSAEAYLGAEPIVAALAQGADIVVTTRVADPSIFLAPMMYEFGWDPLDHARVGAGSAIGHILECGAQSTGGYFADPGIKDVPNPWGPGFSDRRGGCGRGGHHQQGHRHRRDDHADDGQGADPLRGPRPGQLHHPGRRGRLHHGQTARGRAGPGPCQRDHRQAADGRP